MPPLQIMVIGFAVILLSPGQLVVLSLIIPGSLAGFAVLLAPVDFAGLQLVLAQLEEGPQLGLALVRQVVGDAPVEALREYVVGRQGVDGHAEGDLKVRYYLCASRAYSAGNSQLYLPRNSSLRGRRRSASFGTAARLGQSLRSRRITSILWQPG